MRRLTYLLFVCVALLVSAPAWAVEIAPELQGAVSVTPTSGGPGTVISRVAIFTNTRQSTDGEILQLGPIAGEVGGEPVQITVLFTRPGTTGERQMTLDMPVPAGTTFQPGSLKVASAVQPDPVIVDGKYSLNVKVPTATTHTSGLLRVEDKLLVTSTTVDAGPEVRASVNTASLTLSDGMVILATSLMGLLLG